MSPVLNYKFFIAQKLLLIYNLMSVLTVVHGWMMLQPEKPVHVLGVPMEFKDEASGDLNISYVYICSCTEMKDSTGLLLGQDSRQYTLVGMLCLSLCPQKLKVLKDLSVLYCTSLLFTATQSGKEKHFCK